MLKAFCIAKVVSKTHEQRRESWKKRIKWKGAAERPVEALYSVAGNHGIALDRNESVGV